jgi:vitamin B12 transporter
MLSVPNVRLRFSQQNLSRSLRFSEIPKQQVIRLCAAGKLCGRFIGLFFIMVSIVFTARRAWLALALSCAFTSAFAQTSSPQESIVVTASRSEQRVTDALSATQVITRAEIDRSNATDLPALLRMFTSADIAQAGSTGKVTSAFLRGADSRHTLVLIDGVPINQADFGRASLEHLPLDQIERVEIVRGNLSALYGSQAVGGVIQVFTRKAIGMSASLTAGSRSTLGATGQIGTAFGDTRLNLSLAHQKTDGVSAQNPETNPGADPDKDGYRNSSASLALSQQLAKGQDLSFRASSSRARNEYDDGFATSPPVSKHNIDSLAVHSKNAITSQWTSNLDLAQIKETLDEKTGFTTAATNRTRQALWDNSFALTPEQALQFGLEYKRNEFNDTPSSNYPLRTTKSARLGYLGEAGPLQWQLNVRHDKISDIGSANTYYAGASYKISNEWRVLGSASTSFSAPSFIDLTYADPAAAALKPERGESREVGVQYAQTGLRVRLTAFDAKIKDKIDFDPLTFYTSNIARSSNKGVDLSASVDLPTGKLGLEASVNDPRNDETGKSLLRRSRRSAALNYAVTDGLWDAAAYVKYIGERPDVDPVSFATVTSPATTRVDFTLGYRFTKQWQLSAKLENAFNARKDEVLGFTTTPRGVFLTLRYAD